MSQQEFFPSSQSSKADELGDAEIAIQRPRSWSNRDKTGDITKNEHPSAYEEELPPYSYPAQDRRSASKESEGSGSRNTHRENTQQRFSADGDAMEHGYRPWQASSWAQARRRPRIVRWVMAVLLIVLMIKLIPLVATIVLTLLGIGLFLVVLPILIVLAFVAVFGGLVLFILHRMGIPVGRLFRPRRWNNNWRRW
jgi:hypothetical protein